MKDKNLAKVVRVKRLYHKKTGRADKGPVEDNYCFHKYDKVFSDSEEEDRTKKPLREKQKYNRQQNSHRKNIQWLEKLTQDGIKDIGLKQSVEEVTKKLEKRLAEEEEEHQRNWNEIKMKHWNQQPQQPPQQPQGKASRSKLQPTPEPGTTDDSGEAGDQRPGERIRKPPFQIELWEMPKHIEAIPVGEREGNEDYQDWKEMIRSRGDIKDQLPRFEYLLPHFKIGYRATVQNKIEKSEIKGMDYVDRETKAWSEALKEARKLNPWASSGKEFKPSMDNEYHDLLKANNGSKTFASLKERTPRLPNAKTGKITTFEIKNQMKIWRTWCLNEGIPWTSMSHYIYRTEILGEKLMTHYQQKMAAFPIERTAIVQLSTYIEDQLCFTTDSAADNYDETLDEVIKEHVQKLTGATKSTQYLRAHFPTDVKKLMAMHSNYKKMEAFHMGNVPESETNILRGMLEHGLIREIITRAHLKPPIMETYLNVANTSQAHAANWDTRGWQEFTTDIERIFKVHKEQDKAVWKVSKTLEKKIESIEQWQGQLSEELKAAREEKEARNARKRAANSAGEGRAKEMQDKASAGNKQDPDRKPKLRGKKKKYPNNNLDPRLEEICDKCKEENRVKPYDGITKIYRIRKMCLRKGHCLQHGNTDCQRSNKCKERNRTQAIRIAMSSLKEVGCTQEEIEHRMQDGVCLFENQACQPDSKGNYLYGFHREDCPAEEHTDEDLGDPTWDSHSTTDDESDDETTEIDNRD